MIGTKARVFQDLERESSNQLLEHHSRRVLGRFKDNRLPSEQFGKPTRKAGVPHVKASLAVLESMLTVRIHREESTCALVTWLSFSLE